MVKIKFGGQQLLRAAERFEEGLMGKVSDIVFETGRLIQAEAKARAPVDDGSLRDSIEMRIDGKYKCVVTVGVHYAIYIEFGTGIYAENGNGRKTPWTYWSNKLGRYVTTEGMKAQPFWNESVDIGKDYFMTEMRRLGL